MKKFQKYLYCGSFLLAMRIASAHAEGFKDQIEEAVNSGSEQRLSLLSSRIEAVFKTNATDYFQYHEQFEAALEKRGQSAVKELRKQMALAMEKQCAQSNAEVALDCFAGKEKVANRLMRTTNSKPELELAEQLARFVGEVRTAIIPGYHRQEVELNVLPPIQTGPINAGMDPKAIADPVARAAYEKAIAENSDRSSMNTLQMVVLPKMDQSVSSNFIRYVKTMVDQNPQTKEQTTRLSALAKLTEQERKDIQ